MSLLRLVVVAAAVLPTLALAQTCPEARIRDVSPLAKGIQQDRELVLVLQKTAQVCAQGGEACDIARNDCNAAMTRALKDQIELDDGAWLRDMMLQYVGQSYPLSKPIAIGQPLPDVSCNLDVTALGAAAARRLGQSERRQAILGEYPRYVKWANDMQARCKTQTAADQARMEAQRSEQERLAAAAAAAAAAERQRQSAQADAKQKAIDDAKTQQERREKAAQDAKDAQERAHREAKEAQEKAQKEREEQAKQAQRERENAQERAERERKEAQERAENERDRERRDKQEAAERAEREKEKAVELAQIEARRLENQRAVNQRESHKEELRAQKAQLLAAAQAEVEAADADIALRKAQLEQQGIVEAEARRDAAMKKRAALMEQAGDVQVKFDDERPRGGLAILGGGGFGDVGTSASRFSGALIGAQAMIHFGFWGTAPATGMASGVDVRILGRFAQSLGGTDSLRSVEGLAAVRYFFGPLAVGVAGEARLLDTRFGGTARSATHYAGGPALAIAMVDTPTTRVMLNAQWLPLGTSVDVMRFVGDLEVSYEIFTLSIAGGTVTDPGGSLTAASFSVAGFAGVRLRW